MFLHCFPIIPVATEQCDTKRQSLQNFFMGTEYKKDAPKVPPDKKTSWGKRETV